MTTEQQVAYRQEFLLRQRYNQLLGERVLQVVGPVLDQEEASPEFRQQLEEILAGHKGRIQIGEAGVKTLFDAGLLRGFTSSTAQLDAPGWRDIREPNPSNFHDRPRRYDSYFIRLPETEESALAYHSLDLKLEAEGVVGEKDFIHWVIERI